jgi:hypothetical protein
MADDTTPADAVAPAEGSTPAPETPEPTQAPEPQSAPQDPTTGTSAPADAPPAATEPAATKAKAKKSATKGVTVVYRGPSGALLDGELCLTKDVPVDNVDPELIERVKAHLPDHVIEIVTE